MIDGLAGRGCGEQKQEVVEEIKKKKETRGSLF
jgi:hypothetical protein